ncbi:MAG: amidase [Burkholderiales bacterium]
MNPICLLPAVDLAAMIRRKEVSCEEVMRIHLEQIDRMNPEVNAIVTLVPDQAMQGAREADSQIARGDAIGLLHGLPVAHKDLMVTKGIRTTFGSPIFKDFVPDEDGLIVQRLRAGGAITVGKTNTPEFGAGSQTFNAIFGATKNPYDLTKTCGGSSGGAAVALACGMVPIADGSDLGGSLRNPASFCNIAGFRPSPGRVPNWPALNAFYPLSVVGPMARTVQDLALMLSTIAGPDTRAPLSIAQPASIFAQPLARDFKGTKVAWGANLGGFEVDQRVSGVLDSHRHVLEDLGCIVEDAHPDFQDADEIFQVLRAYAFEANFGELLSSHRHQMKETVVWNIEAGRKLSGAQVGRAEAKRTALYHRVRTFMEQYEYLVLPVVQVPPFDIAQEYVMQINGQIMQTYIDWMRSCYFITVTGCPAISVPSGFTQEGLPVGLQIVGAHQQDFSVLQLAYAFQEQVPYWKRKPALFN